MHPIKYVCSLAGLLLALPAQASVLKFSIPTGENSVNKQQMTSTLNKMFEVMKAKTGVTLVLDSVAANTVAKQKGLPGSIIRVQEFEKKIQNKTTDVVAVMAEEYLLSPILSGQTTPIFAWTVNNQKYGKECIYVKAGSPFTSLASLKGKKFAGLNGYLTVRKILAQHGVNSPPQKFFGQLQFFEDPQKQYQSLIDGKTDAFQDSYQGWYFYKNIKPAFKAVKPLVCIEQQPFLFFTMRNTSDKTSLDKVLNYLVSAHRDPSMGIAKWFFLAYNGSFFKTDATYLNGFKALIKEATAKGWLTEAKKWKTTDAPAAMKAWMKAGG